ncbi:lytic transglycosylase domain-containing protein, partial [Oharaeibacter diazotrophicus]
AEAAPRTATKPAATAERPANRTDLRALVRSHAEAAGVPADLAEAVVKVESNFNPRARGSHGEVGLMQIKPSTARAIGYRGTTAALYDPDTNLAWGMRYLARAYALADGDTCGAILRYNGGHAARKMTRQASAYCGRVKTYVAAL